MQFGRILFVRNVFFWKTMLVTTEMLMLITSGIDE